MTNELYLLFALITFSVLAFMVERVLKRLLALTEERQE